MLLLSRDDPRSGVCQLTRVCLALARGSPPRLYVSKQCKPRSPPLHVGGSATLALLPYSARPTPPGVSSAPLLPLRRNADARQLCD